MNKRFSPLAYVSLRDAGVRDRVVSTLERAGWLSIERPTGFHLLQSIADVVDGSGVWMKPGLIVIDAFARGCAGTTIALGLRDLGIEIPVVLVRAPEQPVPITGSDHLLHVVDAAGADRAVAAFVQSSTHPQEAACNPTSSSRTSSSAA